MPAFSRGLRSFNPRVEFLCSRCVAFSTTATVQSGHNRWSKIKHDKGAADMKKNVQRSQFSKEICLASKLGGGDPNTNPRLASIVANARKAGFPKASVDAAIARGQGKSLTGAALESLTLECIIPPQIAVIVEAETDNRKRAMADLRLVVKTYGGTATPTSYLFQRRGRVAFERDERELGIDDVLDDAIEAGAEDVELDEDGGIVVWTEPNMTNGAANTLSKAHGLKVESSDIIWDPNLDTKVEIQDEHAMNLMTFLDALRDSPSVLGVYANVAQGSLSDDMWENLQEKLEV